MTSDNKQRRAVNGCLTKHNLAYVYDLMLLISEEVWQGLGNIPFKYRIHKIFKVFQIKITVG